MTWAEVKKQIEDGGVTDDMVMWYIDISFDGKLAVSTEVKEDKNDPNYIGFAVYN